MIFKLNMFMAKNRQQNSILKIILSSNINKLRATNNIVRLIRSCSLFVTKKTFYSRFFFNFLIFLDIYIYILINQVYIKIFKKLKHDKIIYIFDKNYSASSLKLNICIKQNNFKKLYLFNADKFIFLKKYYSLINIKNFNTLKLFCFNLNHLANYFILEKLKKKKVLF